MLSVFQKNDQYPGHHSPHHACAQSRLTTVPSSNCTAWECNSVYSSINNCSQGDFKPYNENPLSDRVDEFFTTIPVEKQFSHLASRTALNNNTNIISVPSTSSSDFTVATETSEDGDSSTMDDDKEESCNCNCEQKEQVEGEERVQPTECPPITVGETQSMKKLHWKRSKTSKPKKSNKRKRDILKVRNIGTQCFI